MSNEKKVVQLRSGQNAGGSLPAIFAACHECGWQFLSDHMQKLLDNADDALFELADRALNASEQNLYFEAMREIRVHRRRLEDDFRNHLFAPFHALVGAGESTGGSTLKPLELLDYDDMEEQVAVESMASKASKRFVQPIASLMASFEGWSASNGSVIAMNENQLPLGPLAICDAFAKSTRDLDISIKPKLVLFKLFDRHVVSEFGGLYQELAEILRAAGLYIESNPVVKKTEGVEEPLAQPVPEAAAELTEATDVVDVDELAKQSSGSVFDVLKSLFASAANSPGDSGKIQISRASLMSVLQELQGSELERLLHASPQIVFAGEFTQLTTDMAERLRGIGNSPMNESEEGLAQRDFDVINLVSLLFQYILEDESVASPMRGLIAHLQIPVLKAAMLDKRFFSKEGHPARLLLNTIADACIGWQPEGDIDEDPLYVEIESIVKDVLSRADGTASVFDEALEEFKVYLQQEQRRAEIVNKRLQDVQDSQKVADEARKAVDELLDLKMHQTAVPEPLSTILREGWSKVLFLNYVQHGKDSGAWQQSVTLVDSLIWSVQPVANAAHRDKLLSELPTILEDLRSGLNQVGYNPYDLKEQLQQLETVHLNRLRKLSEPGEEQNNKNLDGTPVNLKTKVDDAPSEKVDLDALDASLAKTLGEGSAASEKELEEAERRLARLQVGNWVEIPQEAGKTLRCRLAAVIASTGRHIFVNRSGMKVAEYEKADLVAKLASDQMALLDDGMLFDRALESVISNLRDMKDKPV